MSPAFDQPDEDGTTTAVWQDLSKAALVFADALKVNTDGTRRSYGLTGILDRVQ
jgi:hypothetical protein